MTEGCVNAREKRVYYGQTDIHRYCPEVKELDFGGLEVPVAAAWNTVYVEVEVLQIQTMLQYRQKLFQRRGKRQRIAQHQGVEAGQNAVILAAESEAAQPDILNLGRPALGKI
ncbi:hypothetical protein FRB94_001246 [Tulasnella sp. JGI-2019a]|nr:hypothetical protein FRB93_007864 [Tulasnella sp. JGI-2019a]KAG9013684.1 hypothetical protein FRB94_001246 [Tulasnella sp. JGI-2019a]KAG9037162.1 hypothetical protein FRB95_006716 [Tulasnella sp. JGI-2019a]